MNIRNTIEQLKHWDQNLAPQAFVLGVNVWQMVRFAVVRNRIDHEFARSPEFFSCAVSPGELLCGAFWIMRYAFLGVPCDTVLIFGTAAGQYIEKGKYANRLYDDLARASKHRIVIVEESYQGKVKRPRYPGVKHLDWILAVSKIVGLVPGLRHLVARNVSATLSYIRRELCADARDPVVGDFMALPIATRVIADIIREHMLHLLLRFRKPKCIVQEDASYGARQFVGRLCKRLNVPFVEMQHGAIARIHPAYQYGAVYWKQRRLNSLLPEYLLTFGDFWNQMVCTPSQTRSIGFLYIQRLLQQHYKSTNGEPVWDVLLVSDGNLPEAYRQIATLLIRKNPDLRIALKPHPGESLKAQQRYGALSQIGVDVVVDTSVYELITRSKSITGCYSTVLFEALAFEKPVFVLANEIARESFPLDAFFTADTPEQLAATIVKELNKAVLSLSVNQNIEPSFWKLNPKIAFDSTINNICH